MFIYLFFFLSKARQLNGTLKTLQAQFVQTEEEERGIFTQLSTAIKYCHEQERTQSEQSKYWYKFKLISLLIFFVIYV